jgi:RNA polymerase sigma-70 factor (ECF subfamily)
MIEDKLLVWKFKHGSNDALCRIYEKYKDNLLRLASGLLNDRNAAEDIVHDCFIAFAKSADRLNLRGNLRSYLSTCVVNRVRSWHSSRGRHKTTSLDRAEAAVSDTKRPEQWIIENERLKQLNNALARLPYEQRETISLHLQGGMKFREIARSQDVSTSTIQSRYRYGLDRLRSILDSEAKL